MSHGVSFSVLVLLSPACSSTDELEELRKTVDEMRTHVEYLQARIDALERDAPKPSLGDLAALTFDGFQKWHGTGGRAIPAFREGVPAGFKFLRVQHGSIWEACGVRAGDIVVGVGPDPMSDAFRNLGGVLEACVAGELIAVRRSGRSIQINVQTPAHHGNCGSLARTACLESASCTLQVAGVDVGETEGDDYICRTARGPCEVGIVQAHLSGEAANGSPAPEAVRQECDRRAGCHFDEGNCYCRCRGYGQTSVPDGNELPQCICECAGGPPPSCVADNDLPD